MGSFAGYPFHIFLILANEFCERFSFYGMKAVLVFFLWKALNIDEHASTAIYHTFVVLCYASPLLGAMIADGWLGKYKTILFVSMIYAIGNILMTVSAIPINGSLHSWICFLALAIIAFGTGGIKPCVSSFGGDQFKDEQIRYKESFFSLFYLTINVGSVISTVLIPYFRGNEYCYGMECYALCFGLPAILMITSIVLFAIGTRWYTKNPPGDSILKRFFGCVGKALSRKCSCSKSHSGEKKDHWMDNAAPEYDQTFIADVKDVLRVTWLFIPLPVFWALFDQQGSKWALQAQQMNGELPTGTVFPDMISFMNPLLVVIFVPLLEYVVYPCFTKLRIPNRPLQRMTVGMFLAGTAFLITSFLQIAIDKEIPTQPGPGQTKFQIINASPNHISGSFLAPSGVMEKFSINSLEMSIYYDNSAGTYDFTLGGKNVAKRLQLQNETTHQIFLTSNDDCVLFNQQATEQTEKGESRAWIFNGLPQECTVSLKTVKGKDDIIVNFGKVSPYNISVWKTLIYATFQSNTSCSSMNLPDIESKNGAVYTILLVEDSNKHVVLKQLTVVKQWSLNIFLQTPQYIVMSLGECLFSVTGLAFAYTQAPATMKSILTSVWLLTVCFGNIIIIIVQGAAGSLSKMAEFFLFTVLMYVTTVIFAIMSYFYKYVTPRPVENLEMKHDRIQSTDNLYAVVDDMNDMNDSIKKIPDDDCTQL